MTFDFQQCGILTWIDSDEPVQPLFKLRNFKNCSVSSLIFKEYSSDKQRLWSDCAYAQADLRLCWSHIPHCWKSHVAAQLWWEAFLTEWKLYHLVLKKRLRSMLHIFFPLVYMKPVINLFRSSSSDLNFTCIITYEVILLDKRGNTIR